MGRRPDCIPVEDGPAAPDYAASYRVQAASGFVPHPQYRRIGGMDALPSPGRSSGRVWSPP
ncbi:MAG: hypothetical protein AB1497_10730, partial [Bacillota bacterium]